MSVRPSVILTANVDSRLDPNSELTQAIKRSYLYIAPTRVKFHEEEIGAEERAKIEAAATDEDGNVNAGKEAAASLKIVPPRCIMRIAIRLHKPYWETDNPAAVELWDSMMDRWLRNITTKVSNTMVAFNTMRRRNGGLEVPFGSVQYEFDGKALVDVELTPDCAIPENAPAVIKRVRAWFNSGITAQSVAVAHVALDDQDPCKLDGGTARVLFTDGTSREVAL